MSPPSVDPPPDGGVLLDPRLLLARVAGNHGLAAELVALFLNDYLVSLTELARAVAERDLVRVEKPAQMFKAQLELVGAARAARAAEALSRSALDPAGPALEPAFHTLVREIRRLEPQLRSLHETLSSLA